MTILIRCDSSNIIGTGHVYRCINLAHRLKKSGQDVQFICRVLEGNSINIIEEDNFKVIKLPSSVEDLSELEDARGLLQHAKKSQISWVIVDHYGLAKNWELLIRKHGIKILALDDLLRPHSCEAILDQNYRTSRKLNSDASIVFEGPQYALLSKDILETPPNEMISKNVRRILVFFGGNDYVGETLKFMKAIPHLEPLDFDLVVGKNNHHLPAIIQESRNLATLKLHIQTKNMAELMSAADLFVGAGGITTWERCFMGLPAICVSTALNQEKIAEDLHSKNIHLYLGKHQDIKVIDYIEAIKSLSQDVERRTTFSKNSRDLKVASKLEEVLALFEDHVL